MEMHTNWLAVFVGALAYFMLGWAWHSPLLFMKTWAKEMGFDKLSKKESAKMKKGMTRAMVGNFLALLVTGWVLSFSVSSARTAANFSGFSAGLIIAFWIWLGYIATTSLNSVFWEGRSWKLYFINVGYHLAGLLLMGGILAAWM